MLLVTVGKKHLERKTSAISGALPVFRKHVRRVSPFWELSSLRLTSVSLATNYHMVSQNSGQRKGPDNHSKLNYLCLHMPKELEIYTE